MNSSQPPIACIPPSRPCKDGFYEIPPGCFIMGAPRNEWGAARFTDVQVQVTLTRGFEIGENEITYAEWVAEGFEPPQRDILGGAADCRDPSCPVSNVSLFDAVTFANRYSERRGLPPCYELRDCSGAVGGGRRCRAPTPTDAYVCEGDDNSLSCGSLLSTAATVYDCPGYRLPTEAEWEYAARAGTRTAFWTGPIQPEAVLGDCQADPTLDPIAWYCVNADGHAHPVGQKPANPWGLHDVLGNVREFTTDVISGLGYGQGPRTDPLGYWLIGRDGRDLMPTDLADGEPAHDHGFVSRGGAHVLPSSAVTSDDRTGAAVPEHGDSTTGFRLVRTLPH